MPLSPSSAWVLIATNTRGRRIRTYSTLAVTSETLVPFSLAILLLLQLLLLELLGFFGSARVCIEVEVSIGTILDYPRV
jgi:hypothetical protein